MMEYTLTQNERIKIGQAINIVFAHQGGADMDSASFCKHVFDVIRKIDICETLYKEQQEKAQKFREKPVDELKLNIKV
jgi:hypothetical protein